MVLIFVMVKNRRKNDSMAKVFIGVGHGGKDPGAVGYVVEKDLNLIMALACRDYLLSKGIQVRMSRMKDEVDSLAEEVREGNAYNPDLAIDCHNNSGGGNGFEIFYSVGSREGKALAKNIEKEIIVIGQNSRGIKTKVNSYGKDYYGFIRKMKCPAVICEGVFVDNKADCACADTEREQKEFGYAYAKGVLKTLEMLEKISDTGYIVNKEVANLQKALNVSYGCNLVMDGSFGPDTQKLVSKKYLYYKRPTIKNEHVSWVQQRMNDKCHAKLVVDGSFGPKSRAKLLQIQKQNGLKTDGFAGVEVHKFLLV